MCDEREKQAIKTLRMFLLLKRYFELKTGYSYRENEEPPHYD
jgi:hypothetical protein